LRNEKIAIKGGGIVKALSQLLQEEEATEEHTLRDVLSNLPFIHRAYRYTFRSHPELFIPLRHVVHRKDENDYIWLTARIEGRFADGRSLPTLPSQFEIDEGYNIRSFSARSKRRRFDRKNSESSAAEGSGWGTSAQ
jgi:hypothetical protein